MENRELQGLARIRGHLDVMAQQLHALGEIEEAHKAEKNVVLEKLEHARIELFTAIDAAMPRINHEKAIVRAALDFVELPGDRERLSSAGQANKSPGNAIDPRGFTPSRSARRSPHTGSAADSAPRSLNFTDVTDVESSGDEEVGSDTYDDNHYDDNAEAPESGWVVVGFLMAILGVGLLVNRRHLGPQLRKWKDKRLESLKNHHRHHHHASRRRADMLSSEKPHVQQREADNSSSSAQHQVSNYELQHLEERDDATTGVMSLTTSERHTTEKWRRVHLGETSHEAPDSAGGHHSQASPAGQPAGQPRSWRWRPHVLLGRG